MRLENHNIHINKFEIKYLKTRHKEKTEVRVQLEETKRNLAAGFDIVSSDQGGGTGGYRRTEQQYR